MKKRQFDINVQKKGFKSQQQLCTQAQADNQTFGTLELFLCLTQSTQIYHLESKTKPLVNFVRMKPGWKLSLNVEQLHAQCFMSRTAGWNDSKT